MRMRVFAAACVAVVLCLAAGCNRGPSLTNISSLEELTTRFNRDAGKPRVILLLSPT